jgi:hypothetical protein
LLVTGKRLNDKVPNRLTVVTSSGKVLEQADTVPLLGLDIDNELSFKEHIDRTCKKIAKRIGVLNKIKS